MTRNTIASLFVCVLGLAACNGPWNMEPDSPDPLVLRVSAMPVAGRPYDTIWVERIQPMGLAERGVDFVKAGSWLRVLRVDGNRHDTVEYVRSPGTPRAWIPVLPDTVPYGATLRLEAHVVWNSAADFPSGDQTTESDIRGETTLPRFYRMHKEMLAPLDMLFQTLSVADHPGSASGLLAALKAEDAGEVARRGVTEATCDSFLQGRFVLRPFSSGDSAWMIMDDALADGPMGDRVKRSLRPIVLSQDVDRERWGGLVTSIGFDPSRARILGPIERVEYQIRGDWATSYDDSVKMFQPGNSRMLAVDDPQQATMMGYPDTMQLPQMVLSYTGRNVVRALAVDRTYAIHHRTMMENESGAWNYTALKGAQGYFAGAAPESLEVFVKAVRDTFPVASLRRTWCRELSATPPRERAPWTSTVDCSGN